MHYILHFVMHYVLHFVMHYILRFVMHSYVCTHPHIHTLTLSLTSQLGSSALPWRCGVGAKGVRGTWWWCEMYGEAPPGPYKRDDGKWDDLAKHRSAWHVVVV